jgi:hypothetical protein
VELNFPSQRVGLKAGESKSVKFSLPWAAPKLWEPGSPNLYYLLSKVKDGSAEDVKETRFGFREVWIDGVNLVLNGKPVHILGNTAHSAHALSLTSNRGYWEEYFAASMRELNFNGLRLMSEVPYPVMPTVCDELGLMVIEQSSNWASPGYNSNYLRAGDEFIRNLAVEYASGSSATAIIPPVLCGVPRTKAPTRRSSLSVEGHEGDHPHARFDKRWSRRPRKVQGLRLGRNPLQLAGVGGGLGQVQCL